MTARHEGMQEQ